MVCGLFVCFCGLLFVVLCVCCLFVCLLGCVVCLFVRSSEASFGILYRKYDCEMRFVRCANAKCEVQVTDIDIDIDIDMHGTAQHSEWKTMS